MAPNFQASYKKISPSGCADGLYKDVPFLSIPVLYAKKAVSRKLCGFAMYSIRRLPAFWVANFPAAL